MKFAVAQTNSTVINFGMERNLPNLGALLEHLLGTLDEDAVRIYKSIGLESYRPRYTPVVRLLAEQGPASIRRIADGTSLTHSAASQTVAQMVRHALVTTRAGTKDRRERLIELTPKARKMLPQLRRCWRAMDAASAALSPRSGPQLEDSLREAIGAVERESFFNRVVAILERQEP
jgi:DNA-binding MarR family transcriptional regulator